MISKEEKEDNQRVVEQVQRIGREQNVASPGFVTSPSHILPQTSRISSPKTDALIPVPKLVGQE